MPLDRSRKILATAAAASCLALGAGVAWAQSINTGVTCLNGMAEAENYALLDSNYQTYWGESTRMRVRATDAAGNHDTAGDASLGLTVTDQMGASVCQVEDSNTGNNPLTCNFNFSPEYEGVLTIKIANVATASRYFSLCSAK